MVPTVDTVRYNYLVSALVANQNPVLLVGPVGTGKTSIAQSVLQSLPSSQWSVLIVNMSAQVRCGTRGSESLAALLSNPMFLLGGPGIRPISLPPDHIQQRAEHHREQGGEANQGRLCAVRGQEHDHLYG